MTAGANCAQITPSEVTCDALGITALNLDGRDRDDAITVGSGTAAATLTGGAGDDVLTDGDGNDTLKGTKVRVVCSVKLAGASAVRAVFRRGGHAVAADRGRSVTVRLARGRYRVVLSYRVGGARKTVTRRVRVG